MDYLDGGRVVAVNGLRWKVDENGYATEMAPIGSSGGLGFIGGGALKVLESAQQGLKVTSLVKNAANARLPQFVSSTLDEAAALTMKQKEIHIFAGKLHPKPYLDQLANKMGGRQNLIRAALENANGRFPTSGVFELPVNIGGTNLTIRGFINNGKLVLNTMF
jgi:hypothetical protein